MAPPSLPPASWGKSSEAAERQLRAAGYTQQADAVKACREQGGEACGKLMTPAEVGTAYQEEREQPPGILYAFAPSPGFIPRTPLTVPPPLPTMPPVTAPAVAPEVVGVGAAAAVTASVLVAIGAVVLDSVRYAAFQSRLEQGGKILLPNEGAPCLRGCHNEGVQRRLAQPSLAPSFRVPPSIRPQFPHSGAPRAPLTPNEVVAIARYLSKLDLPATDKPTNGRTIATEVERQKTEAARIQREVDAWNQQEQERLREEFNRQFSGTADEMPPPVRGRVLRPVTTETAPAAPTHPAPGPTVALPVAQDKQGTPAKAASSSAPGSAGKPAVSAGKAPGTAAAGPASEPLPAAIIPRLSGDVTVAMQARLNRPQWKAADLQRTARTLDAQIVRLSAQDHHAHFALRILLSRPGESAQELEQLLRRMAASNAPEIAWHWIRALAQKAAPLEQGKARIDAAGVKMLQAVVKQTLHVYQMADAVKVKLDGAVIESVATSHPDVLRAFQEYSVGKIQGSEAELKILQQLLLGQHHNIAGIEVIPRSPDGRSATPDFRIRFRDGHAELWDIKSKFQGVHDPVRGEQFTNSLRTSDAYVVWQLGGQPNRTVPPDLRGTLTIQHVPTLQPSVTEIRAAMRR